MSADATPPGGLGPDAAARVLRADDRNTVAKVAAGEKLGAGARVRLETAALTSTPTAEELSQLKANRQASLIRKWSAGEKLTREQMAEVHEILPPEILSAPPLVDGSATSSRLDYADDYADYARKIGVSERTIKRWTKRGKEVGELFPLDNLPLAIDWWTRHMRQTPPAALVNAVATAKRDAASPPAVAGKAARPAGGKPVAAASASSDPAAGAESEPGKPLMDRADMVAGTIEENLHRLHIIHSANLTLLEKAFGGSNEADIINRQRNAARSGEMLNAAQKAFDEYQRARGAVVSVAEVKRDLLRIHSAMAQSLLSVIEDLGVPRARCVAAADAWFRMLRESDFFFDTQPDVAAISEKMPAGGAVSTPS